MTAALFVEAVDTALALADTVWQWLIVLSTVAAILLLAACAGCAWAVDAAWEWLYGLWRRSRGSREESEPDETPGPPQRRTARRVPKWAHTQPIEHEWDEAA